jgi:hypothetical protein
MVSLILPPCYALSVSDKRGCDSLHAEGQIGEKAYLVTVDTRASVRIARLGITAGLPKRVPHTQCALQTASRETLLILKEASVTSTLGRRPLRA